MGPPITSKVVSLRAKVISFKQQDNDSLAASWECFNLLIDSSPTLALQDHVLIQHFYVDLRKQSSKYLNVYSRESFLHLLANKARKILDNILANKLEEPSNENSLEGESGISEPDSLPYPSESSNIRSTRKGGNSNFRFCA